VEEARDRAVRGVLERARSKDIASQARGRVAKARIHTERGEFEAGERLGREAIALSADSDDLFMRSQLLMGLADVLRRSGREDKAKPVLEEAAEISERKGNVVTAEKARAQLADIVS
jgi:hypothetical protein